MTKLNKSAYIKLIEEDVAELNKHMPAESLERQHIEAVLRDSVKLHYRSEEPDKKTKKEKRGGFMDYEKMDTSELLKKFGMLYHLTHYDITLLTREACQNYDRVLGELERRLSNSAGDREGASENGVSGSIPSSINLPTEFDDTYRGFRHDESNLSGPIPSSIGDPPRTSVGNNKRNKSRLEKEFGDAKLRKGIYLGDLATPLEAPLLVVGYRFDSCRERLYEAKILLIGAYDCLTESDAGLVKRSLQEDISKFLEREESLK